MSAPIDGDKGEAPLPEDVGEAADVEINYYPDDIGIKVIAVLDEASVTVEHSWEAAENAATLVQALPSILMAVEEALNQQEEPPRD